MRGGFKQCGRLGVGVVSMGLALGGGKRVRVRLGLQCGDRSGTVLGMRVLVVHGGGGSGGGRCRDSLERG